MTSFVRRGCWCLLCYLLACDKLLGIPSDPQAEQGIPEAGSGAGSDLSSARWACLAATREPPSAPSEQVIPVRVRTCSFFTPNCSSLIDELTGRVCSKLDPGCRHPLVKDFGQEQGTFSFEVPVLGGPFDGYLAIYSERAACYLESAFGDQAKVLCSLLADCNPEEPSGESCDLPRVPKTMLFFNPPLAAARVEPFSVPVLPMASISALLAAGGGGTFDSSHGIVMVTIEDCEGVPIEGMRVSIDRQDSATAALYFDNGVPTVQAMQTDASGMVGLAGVPEGYIEVSALLPDGRVAGRASVLSEGLSVSYVVLSPLGSLE